MLPILAPSICEAWVTAVVEDNDVIPSLILLDSLKRAKKGKNIGVITCHNVSGENRYLIILLKISRDI